MLWVRSWSDGSRDRSCCSRFPFTAKRSTTLWAWIVSIAVLPGEVVGGLWTAGGIIAFALVVSGWPVAVF